MMTKLDPKVVVVMRVGLGEGSNHDIGIRYIPGDGNNPGVVDYYGYLS